MFVHVFLGAIELSDRLQTAAFGQIASNLAGVNSLKVGSDFEQEEIAEE
jgi:hypothetical protein